MNKPAISNLSIFGLAFVILMAMSVALILLLKFAVREVAPLRNDVENLAKEVGGLNKELIVIKELLENGSNNNQKFEQQISAVKQELQHARDMVHNKSLKISRLEQALADLQSASNSSTKTLQKIEQKIERPEIKPHPEHQTAQPTNRLLVKTQRNEIVNKYNCPTGTEVKLQFTNNTWKSDNGLIWQVEYAHRIPKAKDKLHLQRIVRLENRLLCYYDFGKQQEWLTLTLLPKPGKTVAQLGPDWQNCEDEGCHECLFVNDQVCRFDVIDQM